MIYWWAQNAEEQTQVNRREEKTCGDWFGICHFSDLLDPSGRRSRQQMAIEHENGVEDLDAARKRCVDLQLRAMEKTKRVCAGCHASLLGAGRRLRRMKRPRRKGDDGVSGLVMRRESAEMEVGAWGRPGGG